MRNKSRAANRSEAPISPSTNSPNWVIHAGPRSAIQPILSQVTADSVVDLRGLPDQKIAGPEHQPRSLLLLALYRHEPHVGTTRRLTDGLGIGGIVLLSLPERLQIGRRNQSNPVPNGGQLACPMMRATACFHRYQAAGLTRKELQQLRARDPLAELLTPRRICAIRLKD